MQTKTEPAGRFESFFSLVAGKFPFGDVVITPGAREAMSDDDIKTAFVRHLACDWGNLDEHDWRANDDALHGSDRLFSQYTSWSGTKFWIITEQDRSVTTILLPEEY